MSSSDEYTALSLDPAQLTPPIPKVRSDPALCDKLEFHVYGYMRVGLKEGGINRCPVSTLDNAQISRRLSLMCTIPLAILLVTFYGLTVQKWPMPFRTHADMSDWRHFGCESLSHEWTRLGTFPYDMVTFVTSCRSLFMRNQVCENIREDVRLPAASMPRTPTESIKMKRDPSTLCVPYPFDERTPFKHSPIKDDGTLVSTVHMNKFWFHYVLPNGDKLGFRGRDDKGGLGGLILPLDIPFQNIHRKDDDATYLTLFYQEHRVENVVSDPDLWMYYKPWASPDVGLELGVVVVLLLCCLLANCALSAHECYVAASTHKRYRQFVTVEFQDVDYSLSTNQKYAFEMLALLWISLIVLASSFVDRWYFYVALFGLWIAQEVCVYHARKPRMSVRYVDKSL